MKFLDGENEKLETSFEWIRMNGRPDIHLLLQHNSVCAAELGDAARGNGTKQLVCGESFFKFFVVLSLLLFLGRRQ